MTTQIALDQTTGDLTLHTGRDHGIRSMVGHDLTLRVGQWSAQVTVDDTGAVSNIRLVAALRSLEVVHADGGLWPLSNKDEQAILSNAMEIMRVRSHPELVFEASDLHLTDADTSVVGRVALAGVSRPLALELVITRSGNSAHTKVRGEIVQSEFGLRPYRGMAGALKVCDMVEIRADLKVALG